MLPLLVLAACGVVYAMLIATRMSPLASFIVGLPFLVLTVLALIPSALVSVLGVYQPIGDGLSILVVSGGAMIVGLVGVMPIVVPSQWARWRARPAAVGGFGGPGGYGGYGGQPAPFGGGPAGSPLVGAGTNDPPTAGYAGENTLNWPQNPPH
ncbi:hypothetical protein [Fodinicola feengrottensis]|uniref:hypothetical protein n=1 Tax=Fodinicola feengrottensis TaxID=435914 RepID=UPI0013D3A4EF|nr:hypothetical protein [Fodinicola feengrottensis]